MFEDRRDAGERLARALEKYRDKPARPAGESVIVLAIPRGGVKVAYHVAKHLNAQLEIIVARKLPFPDNPESGFGAVAEDGSTFIFEDAAAWLPQKTVEAIIERQKKEIERRIAVLRKGRPLPDIAGKTVILVDDGIAMGSTMRAAIAMCKKKKAARIVVATPVTGRDTAQEIAELVDEIVVLETPLFFRAVAQVYRNWYDVPDSEVLTIIECWNKK
jgi:putative phosphoribosyl transferase